MPCDLLPLRMALVVFLRGVNVGGHRTFRPTALAAALAHLEVVNIGAAGTFVVRRRVARSRLLEALATHLPFETDVAVVDGRDVTSLLAGTPFAALPDAPDLVRFVSVPCGPPTRDPPLPFRVPDTDPWMLQVVAREGPFVLGAYRRHPRSIASLDVLDRLFGVPLTTRNWNTLRAIGRALDHRSGDSAGETPSRP